MPHLVALPQHRLPGAYPSCSDCLSTVPAAGRSEFSGRQRRASVCLASLVSPSLDQTLAALVCHGRLDVLTCSHQVLAWAPGGVLSAYPSSFLHGKAAASGWAVVNAVGALMGGTQLWA